MGVESRVRSAALGCWGYASRICRLRRKGLRRRAWVGAKGLEEVLPPSNTVPGPGSGASLFSAKPLIVQSHSLGCCDNLRCARPRGQTPT